MTDSGAPGSDGPGSDGPGSKVPGSGAPGGKVPGSKMLGRDVPSGEITDGAGLRLWTVPNLLSVLRLAGVPLFLWLLLGPHEDGWALVVLALSAISDWADGKLARLLGQYSKIGEMLDPAADRLYILATLIGFVIRGFLPWWVAVLIVGRDVVLALPIPLIRRHGYPPLPVLYLGKAATFALLYAFPVLLLGHAAPPIAVVTEPVGRAFLIWGVAMYLWVGLLYLRQSAWILARTPVVPAADRPDARSLAGA